MALVTGLFQNCFNYTGDTIYKAFTIDNTSGWTATQSYVIYSGDGACYAYISSPSLLIPVSTYSSGLIFAIITLNSLFDIFLFV